MHRVFSVVELLDNIFAFADKQSNANNVCVCKQWSEICLATLWRDVDDLPRLFRILSPWQITWLTYEFTTFPQRNDWKRFGTYCHLVRRISLDGEQCLQFSIVLDVVARNRPTLNLFPNLCHLELLGAPMGSSFTQYSVIFMHQNVKHFVVTLPNPTYQRNYLSSYFDYVVSRMPMLTRLEFQSSRAMHEMENDVLELIHGLPNLQKIVLPPYYLTSRVTESLSHLPNLAEIIHRPESGKGDEDDIQTFEPSLAEGAFPSLHHLALVAYFFDMTVFLNSPFFPSNLTVLQVESLSLEEPSEVHELSVAVAENCRLLTKLCLLPSLDPDDTLEERQMTLNTLRPLLSCPKIASFEIAHQYQLALQPEDIEEIASKWPSLETLKLNNAPVVLAHESQLTLRSLLPFARHCPRLQHLGLFLIASPMDIPAVNELHHFQRLKCLAMGTSPLAEERPVALFLSRICPIGCRVTASVNWWEQTLKSFVNRDRWETVNQLLPLLTTSRVEERERMREDGVERVRMLEAELEALRGKHGNDTIPMQ